MSQELGDRIRLARGRYGMSQAELARRVHISNRTMNLIENNKTKNPGVLEVRDIARTLRVSADWLLELNTAHEM